LTKHYTKGDELRVSIREIKKRTAFADIVTVSRSGPRRVQPECELYGKCGGCDMQHMDYRGQLDAKKGFVRDCLQRIGKIEFDGEIEMIPCPQPFEYRSRARWHIDRQRRMLGYYARETHDVIDVPHCPILTPGLQSSLEYLRESTNWDAIWSDKATIEAASGEEGRVSIHSSEADEPAAELSFTVAGETYAFSAETFFQANKFLIAEMIEAAVGDAKGDTAIDLYSGVGLFTLPLARRFAKVIAVEDNPESALLAKKNLAGAGLENVKLNARSVEQFLRENTTTHIDFLLLDPPRAGTAKSVIPTIAELKPAVLSYVSCEPSILARDLRVFVDAGYTIDSITALDMFPQTHHVETVVRLHI
jgi:23S rRNA (uracil1939-C5)-methyltransferase